ncbi:MAG: nucleotide exchange factor GrpE [Rickettsiaceae bacterium]
MHGTTQEKYFDMEKEEQELHGDPNTQHTPEPENTEAEVEIDQASTLRNLQEQIEQLQDKLLRQLAETENIRTRSAKLIEEAKEYAIFDFAKDMVSVMDNLSRALDHLPKDLDANTRNIAEGIQMTKKELASAFEKHKLELIQPHPGDKFNYHLHHAISQIVTDEYEPGTIVDTMQVGYKIKTRLIRPAAVAVAKKE